MPENMSRKIVASVCGAIMLALEILGMSGLLIPYSTEEVGIRFNALIYPYKVVSILGLTLDLLLFFYLLYSFGVLGKNRTELERQYVNFADMGLVMLAIIKSLDTYFWHYGLFALCLVFRVVELLILLRISVVYQSLLGRRRKLFWAQLPFDVFLGYSEYLLVLAAGTALVAWPWSDQVFTLRARAVLLLLALAVLAMVVGLKHLNPVSMLTVLFLEGAITARHLASEQGYDARFPEIYITSILTMAALVASILTSIIKRRRN